MLRGQGLLRNKKKLSLPEDSGKLGRHGGGVFLPRKISLFPRVAKKYRVANASEVSSTQLGSMESWISMGWKLGRRNGAREK